MDRRAILEKQIALLVELNDKIVVNGTNPILVADELRRNAMAIKDLVEALK